MPRTGEERPPLCPGDAPPQVHELSNQNLQLNRIVLRAIYGQILALQELAKTRQQLEIYKVDQMTGLRRRDAFLEAVRQQLPRRPPERLNPNNQAARQTDPDRALFMMLDVVGLHDINNGGGQVAGDAAIKSTAGFMRQISRRGEDVLGRLGGDEFALFMAYKSKPGRPLGRGITPRIERLRLEEANNAVPPFRYQYLDMDLYNSPPLEEMLALADPKRVGHEPLYSYPAHCQPAAV